jgi:hypothetical protein
MENDLDPIGDKYSAHALRVREVGDTKHLAVIVMVVAVALRQLMLQVKHPGFILVEADQKFRLVGPDLPA